MGRGKDALDRVLRITPQGYDRSHGVARSSLALVKEYLRRVAKWAELFGELDGLGPRDVLVVDLAELLLPESVLAPDLTAGLAGLQLHGRVARQVLAHFVRWETAVGHSALADSGLREPYEPLVRLFERGGELFTHHGFIHVEHCACFYPKELREYAGLPPLLDLHGRTLDELDRTEA